MKSKNKTVYIIAGANGCGKTTIAKELLKEEKDLEFLNADEIAKKINSENVEKVKLTAGKIFFVKFEEFVETGKSFIIESTLSGKYLIKHIENLKQKGYKIILIYVFVNNADTAVLRVKERVKLGGHNIPEEDIRRRFKRSQQNFWSIFRFFVDDWKLVYNGDEIINERKSELVACRSILKTKEFEVFNDFRFEKFLCEVDAKMKKDKNDNKLKERKTNYFSISDDRWHNIIYRAVKNAIETNRKHGIPNTYERNGKIVFEMPDGTITEKNPFN